MQGRRLTRGQSQAVAAFCVRGKVHQGLTHMSAGLQGRARWGLGHLLGAPPCFACFPGFPGYYRSPPQPSADKQRGGAFLLSQFCRGGGGSGGLSEKTLESGTSGRLLHFLTAVLGKFLHVLGPCFPICKVGHSSTHHPLAA